MEIRPLLQKDREGLQKILQKTDVFTPVEIDVAMELIDIVLMDPSQKDYTACSIVDEQDRPLGYICYGLAPMTEATYDLYWIAVDPEFQDQGIGSRLIDFLEKTVKPRGARMLLVETSSIPSYDRTQAFYLRKGFKEVGRVPDYYCPGNDRVTYQKRLL
jgi:ribosomal protein S18 acetylase RimI-like enzyme